MFLFLNLLGEHQICINYCSKRYVQITGNTGEIKFWTGENPLG